MWRTYPLQTPNLYLRPFIAADVPKAYENWMSDDDVTEFLSWDTHRSPEETKRVIGSWLKEYEYGTMEWCIVLKRKEEPIGSIAAVQDFPEKRYCEIGYCIGKDYWGKGYMTEAIKAVTEYIFRNTDYLWIQARCDSENHGSRRCLEKNNYKMVAVFAQANERMGGEIRTLYMMKIERKDTMM